MPLHSCGDCDLLIVDYPPKLKRRSRGTPNIRVPAGLRRLQLKTGRTPFNPCPTFKDDDDSQD